jgi:hypothetical protein
VSLVVKPVGKPDARDGHVRFAERGRETGACQSVSHRARPRLYHHPSPATSSAAKPRVIRPIIPSDNSAVSRVASDVEPVLRQRFCARPECRAMFMICVSCDRGQRYCTPECRDRERLRQRREAQRRYQRSEQGRETHRCRQRRYRRRHAAAAVTDQGPHSITCSSSSPAVWPRQVLCKCHVCGRLSRWIDPFPPIPRRR